MSPTTACRTIVAATTVATEAKPSSEPPPLGRRPPRAASATPSVANQTGGGKLSAEQSAKAAIPAMEPAMSMAYARSGGIARRSGPSGIASAAIRPATSTKMIGRTK